MAKKTLEQQKRAGLKRAVEAVGTGAELARRLGKDPTIVATWFQRGQISHRCVLDVEEITGVPAHELRPDLYRKPQVVA